jgi:hypothetical protein
MANSFVFPQVLFVLGVNSDAAKNTDEEADAIFFFSFVPMLLAALSKGIWRVPIAANVSSCSACLDTT